MNNKVYVLVCMFQGLIDDVKVFANKEESEESFEQYTGVSWPDYEDNTEILTNKDEEQTNIYVTKLK
jgi:hypothetical protein